MRRQGWCLVIASIILVGACTDNPGPTRLVDGRRVPVLEPGGGCDDTGDCAMGFRRAGSSWSSNR